MQQNALSVSLSPFTSVRSSVTSFFRDISGASSALFFRRMKSIRIKRGVFHSVHALFFVLSFLLFLFKESLKSSRGCLCMRRSLICMYSRQCKAPQGSKEQEESRAPLSSLHRLAVTHSGTAGRWKLCLSLSFLPLFVSVKIGGVISFSCSTHLHLRSSSIQCGASRLFCLFYERRVSGVKRAPFSLSFDFLRGCVSAGFMLECVEGNRRLLFGCLLQKSRSGSRTRSGTARGIEDAPA